MVAKQLAFPGGQRDTFQQSHPGADLEMLLVRDPSAVVRHGIIHSMRFELAFVWLFGVILPVAFIAAFGVPGVDNFASMTNWLFKSATITTVSGVVVASATATYVLRRLRLYPGAAVGRWVLPVISVAFGALLAVIVVLRLEYSNRVLLICFLSVLAARFVITAMRTRSKGLVYYLVPGGRVDVVRELGAAPLIPLDKPSLEGLPACAIIADLHADLRPEWERFLAEAAISGRAVYHYKQVWEAETGRVQIDHMSENGFGALVPSLAYQKIKRAVDLLFSIAVMPIVMPVMCICAVCIKLDGGGPVFFRQRRMGFRGREFHVLKFRTMTECQDGGDRELSITKSDDIRITRVGRFLRRTRLDELPQIVNVVRGEMSWIGPRPEAVGLSQWYENEIPFYRYRHIVRPGISGWAQVNQGHVAEMDEVYVKLQYDFYYVKNLSYWLDAIIAFRTIKVMVLGFGSK